MVTVTKGSGGGLHGISDDPPLFEVGPRRSELSEEEQDIPQVLVRPREAHGVLPALGEAEHLLRQLPGLRQRPPRDIYHPQPSQHRDALRRLPHLLTERMSSGKGVFHLRGGLTLGGREHLTEGDLQIKLVPAALRGVREVRQQL
jgi:hypothetical protein